MSVTTTVWCPKRRASIPKSQMLRERAAEMAAMRSDIPCPMIISDHLNDMKSMIDGQIYTSKRAYYEHVRKSNCEIVGNEDIVGKYRATPSAAEDQKHEADIAADVRTAIEQIEARL